MSSIFSCIIAGEIFYIVHENDSWSDAGSISGESWPLIVGFRHEQPLMHELPAATLVDLGPTISAAANRCLRAQP